MKISSHHSRMISFSTCYISKKCLTKENIIYLLYYKTLGHLSVDTIWRWMGLANYDKMYTDGFSFTWRWFVSQNRPEIFAGSLCAVCDGLQVKSSLFPQRVALWRNFALPLKNCILFIFFVNAILSFIEITFNDKPGWKPGVFLVFYGFTRGKVYRGFIKY